MTQPVSGAGNGASNLAPSHAPGASYGEFLLPAPANEVIHHGWWYRGPSSEGPSQSAPVPPSLSADVVLVVDGGEVRWVLLRGPHDVVEQQRVSPGMEIWGLRLWADALPPLFGEADAAWRNRVAPLAQVVGAAHSAALVECLVSAKGASPVEAAVARASADWVQTIDRRGRPAIDPVVRAALLVLEAVAGARAVARVAADVGVARRTLERRVLMVTGTTLKALARGMRLRATVRALHQSARPLAAVAADAGFADQSHLAREVSQLLGTTPTRLRAYLAALETSPVARR
ncbi:MAG: helix-turn-helix domain-containing protein [Gemmatimonadaceae bacterium]|nr:helix-turn-helix domain-containing protein [Gemmatimonadaceae bacterium]